MASDQSAAAAKTFLTASAVSCMSLSERVGCTRNIKAVSPSCIALVSRCGGRIDEENALSLYISLQLPAKQGIPSALIASMSLWRVQSPATLRSQENVVFVVGMSDICRGERGPQASAFRKALIEDRREATTFFHHWRQFPQQYAPQTHSAFLLVANSCRTTHAANEILGRESRL